MDLPPSLPGLCLFVKLLLVATIVPGVVVVVVVVIVEHDHNSGGASSGCSPGQAEIWVTEPWTFGQQQTWKNQINMFENYT